MFAIKFRPGMGFFVPQLVQHIRLRSSATLSRDEDVLDPSAQMGAISSKNYGTYCLSYSACT